VGGLLSMLSIPLAQEEEDSTSVECLLSVTPAKEEHQIQRGWSACSQEDTLPGWRSASAAAVMAAMYSNTAAVGACADADVPSSSSRSASRPGARRSSVANLAQGLTDNARHVIE